MESQKQYLNDRDDGLYFPLVGGSPTENPAMESWEAPEPKPLVAPKEQIKKSQTTSPNNGRPPGSGAPKENKVEAKQKYSFEDVRANIVKSQNLEKKVEKELRKIHKRTRLTKDQKEIAQTIGHIIIANETPEDWEKSVKKYCKTPIDQNEKQVRAVEKIACEHQLDTFMASVLYHSKTEEKK
jgi:hypothetical protein